MGAWWESDNPLDNGRVPVEPDDGRPNPPAITTFTHYQGQQAATLHCGGASSSFNAVPGATSETQVIGIYSPGKLNSGSISTHFMFGESREFLYDTKLFDFLPYEIAESPLINVVKSGYDLWADTELRVATVELCGFSNTHPLLAAQAAVVFSREELLTVATSSVYDTLALSAVYYGYLGDYSPSVAVGAPIDTLESVHYLQAPCITNDVHIVAQEYAAELYIQTPPLTYAGHISYTANCIDADTSAPLLPLPSAESEILFATLASPDIFGSLAGIIAGSSLYALAEYAAPALALLIGVQDYALSAVLVNEGNTTVQSIQAVSLSVQYADATLAAASTTAGAAVYTAQLFSDTLAPAHTYAGSAIALRGVDALSLTVQSLYHVAAYSSEMLFSTELVAAPPVTLYPAALSAMAYTETTHGALAEGAQSVEVTTASFDITTALSMPAYIVDCLRSSYSANTVVIPAAAEYVSVVSGQILATSGEWSACDLFASVQSIGYFAHTGDAASTTFDAFSTLPLFAHTLDTGFSDISYPAIKTTLEYVASVPYPPDSASEAAITLLDMGVLWGRSETSALALEAATVINILEARWALPIRECCTIAQLYALHGAGAIGEVWLPGAISETVSTYSPQPSLPRNSMVAVPEVSLAVFTVEDNTIAPHLAAALPYEATLVQHPMDAYGPGSATHGVTRHPGTVAQGYQWRGPVVYRQHKDLIYKLSAGRVSTLSTHDVSLAIAAYSCIAHDEMAFGGRSLGGLHTTNQAPLLLPQPQADYARGVLVAGQLMAEGTLDCVLMPPRSEFSWPGTVLTTEMPVTESDARLRSLLNADFGSASVIPPLLLGELRPSGWCGKGIYRDNSVFGADSTLHDIPVTAEVPTPPVSTHSAEHEAALFALLMASGWAFGASAISGVLGVDIAASPSMSSSPWAVYVLSPTPCLVGHSTTFYGGDVVSPVLGVQDATLFCASSIQKEGGTAEHLFPLRPDEISEMSFPSDTISGVRASAVLLPVSFPSAEVVLTGGLISGVAEFCGRREQEWAALAIGRLLVSMCPIMVPAIHTNSAIIIPAFFAELAMEDSMLFQHNAFITESAHGLSTAYHKDDGVLVGTPIFGTEAVAITLPSVQLASSSEYTLNNSFPAVAVDNTTLTQESVYNPFYLHTASSLDAILFGVLGSGGESYYAADIPDLAAAEYVLADVRRTGTATVPANRKTQVFDREVSRPIAYRRRGTALLRVGVLYQDIYALRINGDYPQTYQAGDAVAALSGCFHMAHTTFADVMATDSVRAAVDYNYADSWYYWQRHITLYGAEALALFAESAAGGLSSSFAGNVLGGETFTWSDAQAVADPRTNSIVVPEPCLSSLLSGDSSLTLFGQIAASGLSTSGPLTSAAFVNTVEPVTQLWGELGSASVYSAPGIVLATGAMSSLYIAQPDYSAHPVLQMVSSGFYPDGISSPAVMATVSVLSTESAPTPAHYVERVETPHATMSLSPALMYSGVDLTVLAVASGYVPALEHGAVATQQAYGALTAGDGSVLLDADISAALDAVEGHGTHISIYGSGSITVGCEGVYSLPVIGENAYAPVEAPETLFAALTLSTTVSWFGNEVDLTWVHDTAANTADVLVTDIVWADLTEFTTDPALTLPAVEVFGTSAACADHLVPVTDSSVVTLAQYGGVLSLEPAAQSGAVLLGAAATITNQGYQIIGSNYLTLATSGTYAIHRAGADAAFLLGNALSPATTLTLEQGNPVLHAFVAVSDVVQSGTELAPAAGGWLIVTPESEYGELSSDVAIQLLGTTAITVPVTEELKLPTTQAVVDAHCLIGALDCGSLGLSFPGTVAEYPVDGFVPGFLPPGPVGDGKRRRAHLAYRYFPTARLRGGMVYKDFPTILVGTGETPPIAPIETAPLNLREVGSPGFIATTVGELRAAIDYDYDTFYTFYWRGKVLGGAPTVLAEAAELSFNAAVSFLGTTCAAGITIGDGILSVFGANELTIAASGVYGLSYRLGWDALTGSGTTAQAVQLQHPDLSLDTSFSFNAVEVPAVHAFTFGSGATTISGASVLTIGGAGKQYMHHAQGAEWDNVSFASAGYPVESTYGSVGLDIAGMALPGTELMLASSFSDSSLLTQIDGSLVLAIGGTDAYALRNQSALFAAVGGFTGQPYAISGQGVGGLDMGANPLALPATDAPAIAIWSQYAESTTPDLWVVAPLAAELSLAPALTVGAQIAGYDTGISLALTGMSVSGLATLTSGYTGQYNLLYYALTLAQSSTAAELPAARYAALALDAALVLGALELEVQALGAGITTAPGSSVVQIALEQAQIDLNPSMQLLATAHSTAWAYGAEDLSIFAPSLMAVGGTAAARLTFGSRIFDSGYFGSGFTTEAYSAALSLVPSFAFSGAEADVRSSASGIDWMIGQIAATAYQDVSEAATLYLAAPGLNLEAIEAAGHWAHDLTTVAPGLSLTAAVTDCLTPLLSLQPGLVLSGEELGGLSASYTRGVLFINGTAHLSTGSVGSYDLYFARNPGGVASAVAGPDAILGTFSTDSAMVLPGVSADAIVYSADRLNSTTLRLYGPDTITAFGTGSFTIGTVALVASSGELADAVLVDQLAGRMVPEGFHFLGADQDAVATETSFGIAFGPALAWAVEGEGAEFSLEPALAPFPGAQQTLNAVDEFASPRPTWGVSYYTMAPAQYIYRENVGAFLKIPRSVYKGNYGALYNYADGIGHAVAQMFALQTCAHDSLTLTATDIMPVTQYGVVDTNYADVFAGNWDRLSVDGTDAFAVYGSHAGLTLDPSVYFDSQDVDGVIGIVLQGVPRVGVCGPDVLAIPGAAPYNLFMLEHWALSVSPATLCGLWAGTAAHPAALLTLDVGSPYVPGQLGVEDYAAQPIISFPSTGGAEQPFAVTSLFAYRCVGAHNTSDIPLFGAAQTVTATAEERYGDIFDLFGSGMTYLATSIFTNFTLDPAIAPLLAHQAEMPTVYVQLSILPMSSTACVVTSAYGELGAGEGGTTVLGSAQDATVTFTPWLLTNALTAGVEQLSTLLTLLPGAPYLPGFIGFDGNTYVANPQVLEIDGHLVVTIDHLAADWSNTGWGGPSFPVIEHPVTHANDRPDGNSLFGQVITVDSVLVGLGCTGLFSVTPIYGVALSDGVVTQGEVYTPWFGDQDTAYHEEHLFALPINATIQCSCAFNHSFPAIEQSVTPTTWTWPILHVTYDVVQIEQTMAMFCGNMPFGSRAVALGSTAVTAFGVEAMNAMVLFVPDPHSATFEGQLTGIIDQFGSEQFFYGREVSSTAACTDKYGTPAQKDEAHAANMSFVKLTASQFWHCNMWADELNFVIPAEIVGRLMFIPVIPDLAFWYDFEDEDSKFRLSFVF